MGGDPLSRFLLDTHIWFWHLVGSERLPRAIRRLIDSANEPCWLSPVSVWELGLLAQKGRVELDRPYRAWVEEAEGRFPVETAPLTAEIAQVSLELDFPHPDPADRFLAATAIVNDLELLTVDRRLVRSRAVPTRSR